jgi:hypothetical protein
LLSDFEFSDASGFGPQNKRAWKVRTFQAFLLPIYSPRGDCTKHCCVGVLGVGVEVAVEGERHVVIEPGAGERAAAKVARVQDC